MANNMIPNIPSSSYPNVDNMNTWFTQTTFNYALWAANSKLTVTRVPWNEEYKDVVKFEDDDARDAYFASIESISKKIDNAVRIPKDGTVVLPFNFDEVITYNYLIAEYPLPNGYSKKGDKIKTKFFYFIVDMTYKNANVTECTVVLDYWTTFINDVEIGNSCLYRGHAPMTLTSVEDFLSSPIDHTQGLLTPDVNFGVANNVQNEDYVPFHTGTQYVLIATTSNPQGDWTNNTTCINSYVVDGLPTNVYVFAINASNYVNFISKMNSHIPHMLQTILSIFILDESFITLGTSFSFLDTQCFNVHQKETSLKDITLEKSMFNYPTEYDWITKLYTSPYAVLEVTDNNGSTVEINIQDISYDASVRSVSSIAFPYIDVKAFIRGIGGSGSNSYSIKKFTTEATKQMFKDNWQQYTFDVDIPTFGIYQKNSVNYDWSTKFDRIQAQNDILTGYTNTNASINTSYANTSASANTSYNNTERSLVASEQTLANDINTSSSLRTYINGINTEMADDIAYLSSVSLQRSKIVALLTRAADYEKASIAVNSAAIGTITSIAQGNIGNAVGSGIGIVNHGLSTAAMINISAELSQKMYGPDDAIITTNDLQSDTVDAAAANGGVEGVVGWAGVNLSKIQTNKKNDAETYILNTSNNNTQANQIISNTAARNNNIASKNTTDANNDRSTNTGHANNTRSKENSEAAIQNKINQAALGNNVAYSGYSTGGALDSEGLRGLDIKVKTQNSDSIRKAGNIFARYGYIFEDAWTPSNLNLMTLFTYWEFSDIWLTSDKVFETGLNVLREIFTSGVTVWSNPSNIGRVHINSNRIA